MGIEDIETLDSEKSAEKKAQGKPVYCLSGVRHGGNVNLVQAYVRNVGTPAIMIREKSQVEIPRGRKYQGIAGRRSS